MELTEPSATGSDPSLTQRIVSLNVEKTVVPLA